MATFHLPDVPEEFYERLRRKAQEEHRSLAKQVIVLLEKGLAEPDDRKARRLAALKRASKIDPKLTAHLPDFTQMIREDRNR